MSTSQPLSSQSQSESYLSGTSSSYVEEMYEAWARNPASVHASWDAYFRGSAYVAPPSLGVTKANEIPLANLIPALSAAGAAGAAGQGMGTGGFGVSSKVIDAHLAVQTFIRSYQVRGHLAAQIDPLNINNMAREEAKKYILRSFDFDPTDSMDTVFQLPATTFIGGKVCYSWINSS